LQESFRFTNSLSLSLPFVSIIQFQGLDHNVLRVLSIRTLDFAAWTFYNSKQYNITKMMV